MFTSLLVISDKVHCCLWFRTKFIAKAPSFAFWSTVQFSSFSTSLQCSMYSHSSLAFSPSVLTFGWGRWWSTISNFVSVESKQELHGAYFKCDNTVYHCVLLARLSVCVRACVCVCVCACVCLCVPKRCTCQSVWRSWPCGRKYVAV